MKSFYDYFDALLLLSPLLFFIAAIAFRLLDNSGSLLLKKEILIDSSYVSINFIRHQINTTDDRDFQGNLEKVLFLRKLHRAALLLMILSIPVSIWSYFTFY